MLKVKVLGAREAGPGRPLPHMAPPLHHLLAEPWEQQSQQEHLQLDAHGQSHRLLQVHPCA